MKFTNNIYMWAVLTSVLMLTTVTSSPFNATLGLVAASSLVGVLFLMVFLNWLFYSVIILFVGGMMTMFLYLCCLDVTPKVMVSPPVALVTLIFLGLATSTLTVFFEENPKPLFALLGTSSILALTTIGVYLLLGLWVSMKFANKFTGPLKPIF